MAENAFDDQCTGANPRYPMIKELKELYLLAHRGCRIDAALYHQADDLEAMEEIVNV
jgi:acetaldehyde dehydrogenase/alcohol dehydrogenase